MKERGFTLVELLIVISIIGILSVLSIIAISNARVKSRDAKRLSDIKQISTALELYYSDNGIYPTSITPGNTLNSPDGSRSYIDKIPSNPTPMNDGPCQNNNYSYGANYNNSNYTINFCLGSGSGGVSSGGNVATSQGVGNDASLVGWWKLNDGSGAIALDSSGQGNNAVLYNSPVWTGSGSTCKFNNCLVFSNANDYIYVTNSAAINVTGRAVSFGGWVDYTGISTGVILFSRPYNYRLWAKSGASFYCYVNDGVNWSPNCYYTAPASGWHHIMCTYDGSYVRAYLDGVKKQEIAYSANMVGNASANLYIGAESYGGGINTGANDMRLYNKALSDAEVMAIYDATK